MASDYCLVADIVGFSNIMENLGEEERSRRVTEWIEIVIACTKRNKIDPDRWQFVSDTVFVGAPDTESGLKNLVKFGRDLLESGLKESLPVRGGVAHGETSWGDPFAYGPAIVRAHRLCEGQKWVGISCEPSVPHVSVLWSRAEGLVAYAVPMKVGNISVRPAVVWTIPKASDLTKFLTDKGLTRQGQPMDWRWGEIVQNTILYGLYLKLLPEKAHVDGFHGYFPAHLIAKLLGYD